MYPRWIALAALALIACSASDDAPPPDSQAPTITLALSQTDVHWRDGVADSPTVTVLLTAADGTTSEVTDRATFAVSPPTIGAVDAAHLLVPTGGTAGPATLSATVDTIVGDIDFTVYVAATIGGDAPTTVPALFEAAQLDSTKVVEIAYPPADALLPPNVGALEVHWTDPAVNNVYEVTFASAYVTLTTYVKRMVPTSKATWNLLSQDNFARLTAGDELELRVRALRTTAPSSYVEGRRKVRIAAEPVKGGVYYWNVTQGAIMRFDMTTPDVAPAQFYPQAGERGCVGCHAVSRDGTVVAYRQSGSNMNYGNAMKVATLTKQLAQDTQQWNFAAIHPNNTDLFTTEDSGLYRTDLETQVKTPVFTQQRLAHPDISPDGTQVIATLLTKGREITVAGAQLAVFAYDATAKTVGAPRVLVDQSTALFPYYPSFSPDNAWVLFNQAPVATGSNSYDNVDAQLWVTRADGTGTPIHLAEAEVASSHNSWPKFTPFITHEGGETVIWFTFASRRGFGVRSETATQKPQLWLAPFYPDRGASGPAIRLPFQDLAQGNHIAQWTQAIVPVL